jgi:membrane-associated phospholipid phosphatase
MLLLGWVVGKGATPVDDWFHRYWDSPARRLALVTSPIVLVPLLAGVLLVAVYRRRWRLAAVAALAPLVGIAFVRMLKPVFGRQRGGSGLAYPSGHVTTLVVVWGLLVIVAGCAWWAVLVAIAVIAVGMVGVGITFHYFTDTVGGLLLGSAIVCVAALTSGRVAHRT